MGSFNYFAPSYFCTEKGPAAAVSWRRCVGVDTPPMVRQVGTMFGLKMQKFYSDLRLPPAVWLYFIGFYVDMEMWGANFVVFYMEISVLSA